MPALLRLLFLLGFRPPCNMQGMATETTAQKIARLRELLESGVSSDSRDGASTTFDLESVRRGLLRLEQAAGTRRRRPRVINLQMGRR